MRDRTARFLFVLSKTSNQKQGTLDELALARKVRKQIHDFIIPLALMTCAQMISPLSCKGSLSLISKSGRWLQTVA